MLYHGVLVVGTDLDAKANTKVGDEINVMNVAGATGFFPMVTDRRSFLAVLN